MRWTVRPQFIDVIRLRRAALRYSAHGWEVTPGACLAGDRFTCHRAGCPTMGCHPALERWEEAATSDAARIGSWWSALPHTVLLATGRAFDVLEVPAHLGLRVLGLARLHGHVLGAGRIRVGGPLAVTPTGRWMFLVKPGDRLRPELDGDPDVLHHGPGSWIPAPPTRLPEGRVRWTVTPDETHWQLPDSYALQALLVDAIAVAAPPRTVRQLETPPLYKPSLPRPTTHKPMTYRPMTRRPPLATPPGLGSAGPMPAGPMPAGPMPAGTAPMPPAQPTGRSMPQVQPDGPFLPPMSPIPPMPSPPLAGAGPAAPGRLVPRQSSTARRAA